MPSESEPERFSIVERLEHVRVRVRSIKMTAYRIGVSRPRKCPVARRRPCQVSYPTRTAVLSYQPGTELLDLNVHMLVLSWLSQGIGIGLVQLVVGADRRLFLILPLKFQSDRRIFRAEHILLSGFACLSLPGLDVPGAGGRQRDRPYFLKQRGGGNLPMMRCLLPAHR